jgi:5,10-methylenetetrahydrofolate reductase
LYVSSQTEIKEISGFFFFEIFLAAWPLEAEVATGLSVPIAIGIRPLTNQTHFGLFAAIPGRCPHEVHIPQLKNIANKCAQHRVGGCIGAIA